MKNPFDLPLLPISLSSEEVIKLLKLEIEASKQIEKFNTSLDKSPIKKEAVMLFSIDESLQSSRIEGTQATFDEVMGASLSTHPSKDLIEIINYCEALLKAEAKLKTIPISSRLICELHEILLRDSRGSSRSPGTYRRIQNFIGPTNNIKDATYIPPEANRVNDYMKNLELYINDEIEDNLSYIVKAGIIHGQFESIHPFLDGNGRMGRILIVIYLLDKNVISYPAFFMSEELEKNKYKYYSLLNNLRKEEPEWFSWLEFFMESAISQAIKYNEKLYDIEKLYNNLIKLADDNSMSIQAINVIFEKPVTTIVEYQNNLNISYNTARRYIQILEKNKILFGDDRKRSRKYRFYSLLDIFNR